MEVKRNKESYGGFCEEIFNLRFEGLVGVN